MSLVRAYTDGFGCLVVVKHDEQSGDIRISDETPGKQPWGVTFLDRELEELAALITKAVEYNREHGIYPYKGKVGYIDGMEVRIVEPAADQRAGRGGAA